MRHRRVRHPCRLVLIEKMEWILIAEALLIADEVRWAAPSERSEEHTSELQSHSDLVCRLLLEKKNEDELSRAPARLSKRWSGPVPAPITGASRRCWTKLPARGISRVRVGLPATAVPARITLLA